MSLEINTDEFWAEREMSRLRFALADTEALEQGTAERCESLQRQLAQAQAVIKEQKNSIAGLNSCIGGEDSCTTDNLIRVTRLENIIKEQNESIDKYRDSWLSHVEKMHEQSELIEKLAQRIYDLYGPFNKIDAGYDQGLIEYNNWKEGK